jgi:hypothetical protein
MSVTIECTWCGAYVGTADERGVPQECAPCAKARNEPDQDQDQCGDELGNHICVLPPDHAEYCCDKDGVTWGPVTDSRTIAQLRKDLAAAKATIATLTRTEQLPHERALERERNEILAARVATLAKERDTARAEAQWLGKPKCPECGHYHENHDDELDDGDANPSFACAECDRVFSFVKFAAPRYFSSRKDGT